MEAIRAAPFSTDNCDRTVHMKYFGFEESETTWVIAQHAHVDAPQYLANPLNKLKPTKGTHKTLRSKNSREDLIVVFLGRLFNIGEESFHRLDMNWIFSPFSEII